MIRDDAELVTAVARAGADIQTIQDYLGERMSAAGRIRFPYGVIRRVTDFEARLWFVSMRNELRRNLCYTLQFTDVLRWLLNRTTLTGIAQEMVIKQLVCVCAFLIESMTKDFLHGEAGKNASFKQRTERLERNGVIGGQLKVELDWVWDRRASEHVFLAKAREIGMYSLIDSNRAIRALHALIDACAANRTPPI